MLSPNILPVVGCISSAWYADANNTTSRACCTAFTHAQRVSPGGVSVPVFYSVLYQYLLLIFPLLPGTECFVYGEWVFWLLCFKGQRRKIMLNDKFNCVAPLSPFLNVVCDILVQQGAAAVLTTPYLFRWFCIIF
jgi:hypothetical protein